MNYENGKKLTLLGFALFFLEELAFAFLYVLYALMSVHILFDLYKVLDIVAIIGLGAVVIGYALMWLDRHDSMDLITAGATALSCLLYFLKISNTYLHGFICAAYIAPFAIRAKRINNMFSLVMLAAFLYRWLGTTVFNMLFTGQLYMYALLPFGNAACTALCFLEAKNEE